jgi:2-oxoglutarate ferredoxin oxidoreductase subunit gamma
MRHEIIMAGFGGQGIMLMGQILATAAMIENQDVVWHPSYGPEMRGGTAYCTVVLSDSGLGSPVASAFDSAVIMDAPSLGKFLGKIKPGGLLILNTSLVTVPEPAPAGLRVVPVMANELAEKVGDARVANLAMLGAFVEVTKLVATESIPAALRCIIPERRHNLLPLNQRAFDEGARAVRGG